MADDQVKLAGSERKAPLNARMVGPVDPREQIEVSVYLRASASTPAAPPERISREEHAAFFGAHPDDVALVEAFARQFGLQVVDADLNRRVMVLSGSAAAMSRAFSVELNHFEQGGKSFRARTGPILIPAGLEPIVQSVLGLDDRPQYEPRFQLFDPRDTPGPAISFTPPQVAALYNFPRTGKGAGQCVGIVELGGGFHPEDLTAYFAGLGIPTPLVTSVSVDGATNSPQDDPSSADGEVLLDIEVVGAVAPGAHIVVYFAPNSDRGFIDAISTAVFDAANKPSVISISWGSAESQQTAQTMSTMNQVFQSAAAVGVTVCCASGDDGSNDRQSDGLAHADFPASSPFVLACGGTHLEGSGATISSEVVWNSGSGASGGGISDVFALPGYQAGAGVPASANPGGRIGRGVPDVSGDADPNTGYQVRVDGQDLVFGGTSAVAPLWAGLIALLNEQLAEPIGFLNPLLYQRFIFEADVVRDITSGDIGAYQARAGWDPCTGLGSPNGENLLDVIIY